MLTTPSGGLASRDIGHFNLPVKENEPIKGSFFLCPAEMFKSRLLVYHCAKWLGHRYENIYCPGCWEPLIQRFGLRIAQNRLDGVRCPACQWLTPLAG